MNRFVKIFDKVLIAMVIFFILLHVMLLLRVLHVVDIPLLSTRKSPLIAYTALSIGISMAIRSLVKTEQSRASRKPQQPIRSRCFLLFFAAFFVWHGVNDLTESPILLVPTWAALLVTAIIAIVISSRSLRSTKK